MRLLTEYHPKVNRAYHRLIRASPSIQYEIDLFAAGLQRNPRIEPSMISNCRGVLAAYLRRWETVVSGVCGLLWKDLVKFFLLGSVSRGIPGREWNILLGDFEASAFTSVNLGFTYLIEKSENKWK